PPGLESPAREPGDRPLGRHPRGPPGKAAEPRRLRDEVGEPRRLRRDACPVHDQAEGVGAPRPRPALVVVGHELGLVRGDVDAHRALALAPLAGQAEVEGLLHLLALPPVGDRLALEHLEEEVGPAAGGVFLLLQHHEARAHGAAAEAAAQADPDAPERGAGEAPVVPRVAEMGPGRGGIVVGAETEIRVPRVGIDELARVHPPLGVPDRLELAEGLHELVAEHDGEEIAPGLTVPVLAREGAAVAGDDLCGLAGEIAVLLDPRGALEVEVDARVDAPLAEVAVERGAVPEPLQEPPEVAEVLAQVLDGYGGVLPPLPGGRLARHERGGPEPGFPHDPESVLLGGVADNSYRG